jgi:hypothetical protein
MPRDASSLPIKRAVAAQCGVTLVRSSFTKAGWCGYFKHGPKSEEESKAIASQVSQVLAQYGVSVTNTKFSTGNLPGATVSPTVAPVSPAAQAQTASPAASALTSGTTTNGVYKSNLAKMREQAFIKKAEGSVPVTNPAAVPQVPKAEPAAPTGNPLTSGSTNANGVYESNLTKMRREAFMPKAAQAPVAKAEPVVPNGNPISAAAIPKVAKAEAKTATEFNDPMALGEAAGPTKNPNATQATKAKTATEFNDPTTLGPAAGPTPNPANAEQKKEEAVKDKPKSEGKKQRGIGGWFNRIAGTVRDFFSGGKKQGSKTTTSTTSQAPYGVGPNGLPYTKNDVDYLLNQGYTKEDAIQLLSKDKKYTTPLTPEQKAKVTAKTGKQMDPFSQIFSSISNIFNPTASSMQNALNLGGLARSRTSDPGLSIGNITGNPTVDGILGAVVPGIGQVTGQATSRTPVRTTGASQQMVDNTSFAAILEEQKKTNSLLEGILKTIIANGQNGGGNAATANRAVAQETNNIVRDWNSTLSGNSGYMNDQNGKSYTPIAQSLEWMSEPR